MEGFHAAHRVGLLVASVALLALVLELVRRGRLKERYALLWLAAAGLSLLLGAFPRLIEWLAALLHVQYLTVLFAASFVFLLGIVLGFSIVISRQSERNRALAQELGLLEHRVRRLEKERSHDGE
ncbi:MAG TPA: DUF2304 domain-containing protein [Candidatus Hydrogenedentes bacterium]|nr:DUF2304 domain-containing protein [Candidatus Hydrogenedentota bacterium]